MTGDPDTVGGVLLASDLGARCDRAAARAGRLHARLGGEAIAATAIEPALAPLRARASVPHWVLAIDPRRRAADRLRRQLAATGAGGGWRIEVAEGVAGDQLERLLDAAAEPPLVVTGPVREGLFGPAVLGSTVDRVLRRDRATLLMVRDWADADYPRLLVASDFSAPSRLALQRAHALFPGVPVTVLHGFSVPMLGLLDAGRDSAIADIARQAAADGEAFLRDSGFAPGSASLVVEHGDPARLLQQWLDSHGPALVVLGTHGHGAMYELAVGSVARRILAGTDADTLVVRG